MKRRDAEHAAVIAKLSSEHKEALAQVEREHASAMEALAKRIESEYASKLAQLSSEHEEATKEAVTKAREAVSRHHTAEFDSFRADEEKKVQAICHNYEDIITSIKAEKAHAQERCNDLKKIYGELLGSHKEIVESTTVNLKLAKEEYTKEIAAITSKHQQEIEYYQYQVYLLTHALTLTHSLTHLLTHSLSYSLTHLLTHSLTLTHSYSAKTFE
jgi:hypothetical protein